MTVADLLAICVRRWLVLLIGLAATVAITGWVRSIPGVYAAQTDMTFLAPASTRFPNPLSITSGSLISMAGLVEREINQGRPVPASVSASVTLVDLGIRRGSEVRLPNSGGQWAYNFARPVLDIEAVGPTEDGVRAAMDARIAAVRSVLTRLQDDAGVAPRNRITVEASPSTVDVVFHAGHRSIATATALLLGVVFSATAAVAVDAWLRRRPVGDGPRRRREHERPTGAPATPIAESAGEPTHA